MHTIVKTKHQNILIRNKNKNIFLGMSKINRCMVAD